MLPTDLTVSAVVERDGRFLIIEERSSGIVALGPPGGRVDSHEAAENAAIRKVREQTGWEIAIDSLLGVYLWIHPQTRQQFLRIAFAANVLTEIPSAIVDDGTFDVHWLSRNDLQRQARCIHSPIVLRCIDDHLAGRREPSEIFNRLGPVRQNIDAVMANALLV